MQLDAALRGPRGAKRRELLARALADEALVVAELARLTAFELVILEVLVDLRGIADLDTLWDEACRRAGVDRPFDVREV